MIREEIGASRTSTQRSLGADLRSIRKRRGLTLAAVARGMGRSVGWISQVERDISAPSINDLRDFATVLEVPLSLLFGEASVPPAERGYVVRAGARRAMGTAAAGLTEELLSPDLTDSFEVIHSSFAPHSRLDQPIRRETQEVGYVVSGALQLTIGTRRFEVSAGDSFRIRGEPYLWENPHPEPALVIWVISPPVY